jgi:hypothetical protein
MVYGKKQEHPVDAAGKKGKSGMGVATPIKGFSSEDAQHLWGSSRHYQLGESES